MSPRHLSVDEPDVLARLGDAPAVVFGLDYDGTLAPIVARPELANATDDVIACVDRLASDPRDVVAIVTGRSIEDLWERARTRQTWVLGRHGTQIAAPGGPIQLASGLDEEQVTHAATAIRRETEEAARRVPGAFVEDKGVGFALHTRNVDDAEAEARLAERLVELARSAPTHVLLRGKRVLELRPQGIDKGVAFTGLWEREAPRGLPLYIGDDTTDEDAFRALERSGREVVTVRVTDDPRAETAARYWVESPGDVLAFLQSVAELRARGA